MRIQRTTPIVGAGRPLVIEHLVIASITMVLALVCVAAPAAAKPTKTGACPTVTTILSKASSGLLMPSESDYPFTAITWPDGAKPKLTTARLLELTAHGPGTAVDVVSLDFFFRNVAHAQSWHDPIQAINVRKFQRLIKVLRQRLTDIRVYRVGTIQIDVYIVGRCGRDLAGLSTTLIET